MRPLHLSLSGFTAFRQQTELDFTGLDLFAIVGPTGSGKSSLLDAMTFALYGQTARLGATGLDALISQTEKELRVSFTFEVDTEAGPQTYRVTRQRGRRAASANASLERQDGEHWKLHGTEQSLRAVSAQVKELLGLDFRTFTRAVMLPQGEFARVLHGTGKERQELLGELMGLDQVRAMHAYAGDRVKELNFELSSTHALLEGEYAGVSAELVQGLRAQRAALAEGLDAWQDEREEVAGGLTRWQKAADLYAALQDASRRLEVQQGRAAEMERGAERAAQARRVSGILPLIDSENRARIAAERAEREAAGAEAAAAEAAAHLQVAEAAQARALQAEGDIPALEARAEELRDAETLAARLTRAGGTLESRHARPLPWDEDAHAAAKSSAERLEKLKLERVQLSSRRAALEASQARLQADEGLQAQREQQKERLLQEGKDAAARLEAAQQAYAAAQAAAGLAAYAGALQEGEPCPLCGQPVDAAHLPVHPSAAEVERLRLEVEAATGLRDDLRGQYREAAAELGVLQKDLAKRRSEVADTAAQLSQDEQDNRAAAERLPADAANTAARLLAGLAEQLRSFGPSPAAERQRVQRQMAALRRAVQEAGQRLGQAQSEAAGAAATHRAAQAAAGARRAEAEEAAQALQKALALSGLEAGEVKAAALPEDEIAALERGVQTWQAGLATLQEGQKALAADLKGALAGAEYDPEALPRLNTRLAALDAQIAQGQAEAGRLEAQEQSAAQRLERRQELEAGADALSRRLDTWKTLANSLKANEFQQFMLAEVEANLLTGAGQLLHQISDGRYRLVLDGSDYAVQDLWNSGEVRGVKTLSGGETFLASLSLAIALSDYLAGHHRLGALFLDEGFGTLDPQALEAVAGALENLRTQGRMVGVITHVESLSEHLPSRLLVSKSIAGSSLLRLDS